VNTKLASHGYRFRHVAHMEWIKLRTLRSTRWTLALTALGAVAIAAAVGLNTKDGSADLTNNALAGIAPGLLSIGLLGVLTATNEYTSGMIRPTLTAAPSRQRLLAAKAVVFGGVALAVGEASAFLAFVVGSLTLRASIERPSLGDPNVLRALILAGVGVSLIGLIGLGLGLAIRETPAALAVLVGGVYVVAQLIGGLALSVGGFVPVSIVANSLSVTRPMEDMPSPFTGLFVLLLYTTVTLGAGGWLLERRDA
jgi:ABC-2 type transport system permease protein